MKVWRAPVRDRQRSLFTRGHHFATLFQHFQRDVAFRGTFEETTPQSTYRCAPLRPSRGRSSASPLDTIVIRKAVRS